MIESDFTQAFWQSLMFEDIEVHIAKVKGKGLLKVWSADVKVGPLYLGTLVASTKDKLLDKLAEELQAIEQKINSGERFPTPEGL